MSAPAPAAKISPASSGGGEGKLLGFFIKIFSLIVIFLAAIVFTASDPEAAVSFIFVLQLFQIISILIVIFCIYKIARYIIRFQHQTHDLEHYFEHKYHPVHKDSHAQTPYQQRLSKIKEHMYSETIAEWKLGVIEMDTMLRDVLKDNGYTAETVAEQLKIAGAKSTPFATLDNAWEAHKIRNKIAHEGIAFTMDDKEAVRVYRLYTSVFEEFKIV